MQFTRNSSGYRSGSSLQSSRLGSTTRDPNIIYDNGLNSPDLHDVLGVISDDNRPYSSVPLHDSRNPGSSSSSQFGQSDDELLQEQLSALSPLQRLLDKTGLTNFAGNIRANYKTAMEERQYNSVQEMTKRMQQAGLNADLTGVQGSEADESGAMIEGMSNSASGAVLKSFGDSVMSMVTGIVGMVDNVVSIKNSIAGLTNETLQTGLLGDDYADGIIDKLAGDFLNSGDPQLSTIQTDDDLRSLSDNFIDSVLKESSTDWFKGLDIPARQRKILNQRLRQRLGSATGKKTFYELVSGTYRGYRGAKLEQAITVASEKPVVLNGDTPDEIVTSALGHLGEIIFKSDYFEAISNLNYQEAFDATAQANAENATNQYNTDFYNSASGSLAGSAHNTGYQSQKSSDEWNKSQNDLKNKLMSFADDLKKSPNKTERYLGEILPYLIVLFMGDVRLNMPALPSVTKKNTVINNDNRGQDNHREYNN